mgnify:CR=1 FL=1
MTAALRIITASLLLILISLSLRACSSPPPPRALPEPEAEEEEEDPAREILEELRVLKSQSDCAQEEVQSILDDMPPVRISRFVKALRPHMTAPRLDLDRQIRQKGLDPRNHEPSEFISRDTRAPLWSLDNNLVMDKQDRTRAK